MISKLAVAATAAILLTSPALAQPAGAGAGASGGASAGAAAPVGGGAAGTTLGGGVAGGVQPYRPAGTAGANGVAGGSLSTDSSLNAGINSTLQAGQVPAGDATTVGGASTGGVLRTPNAATGTYGAIGSTNTGSTAVPYSGPAGPINGSPAPGGTIGGPPSSSSVGAGVGGPVGGASGR